MKLRDLGERRIVNELLPRHAAGIGDDCAIVGSPPSLFAITTDPVPEPAAALIGGDPDEYWKGWLLVTINASDLAAAGARPLAFVAAVEAPPDLDADVMERFFTGVSEACHAMQLDYVGGNLREGQKLTAVGTAVGYCDSGRHLSRSGAQPGDIVVSVGSGGVFWRDAFHVRNGQPLSDRDSSPLFRPMAKVKAMHTLCGHGLISAAQDNSDGLLPTLQQLSERSGVGIDLDLQRLIVNDCPEGIDPARLWLGWGDWNIIAAIRERDLPAAISIGEACGTEIRAIGTCTGESGHVFLRRDDKRESAPRLESERFAADSWFLKGIQEYINQLLSVVLP